VQSEVTIDRRRVSYIDEGTGSPVLLLHGWNSPAENYQLIINHLSSRYRVLAPNFPGCGGSEEPETPWESSDYASFAVKFAAKMGIENPILIGHSNGGRTIIKLAANPPPSFTFPKIILIDAAGIKRKYGAGYYIKVYSYKLAKRIFPRLAEKMRNKTGSEDYKTATPIMRQTMVRLLNEDMTPILHKIKAPTLLIWGDMDTATPLSDGKLMEKLIPDAGLVIFKGTGHFSFAQAWPQCSRVLDAFI